MSEPARRRRARGLAWLWLLTLPSAAVLAHGPDLGGGQGPPEARLAALPPELDGVRVQLHRTAGAQLVVENTTDRILEVLDERGVPFLRIGPEGVQGNMSAPAWYQAFAPEGGVVPRDVRERADSGEPTPPLWVKVRREPTWGWFDARIASPESHGAASNVPERRPGQAWSVPVRLGEERSALSGEFAAPDQPAGALRARLLSEPGLAPGVRVSMLPGLTGSFFLKSRAEQRVVVLGRDGEPFLRFAPDGVEANLRSATFAEAARLRGGSELALEPRADAEPRWQRVSAAPSYAWVDPRTAADGLVTHAVEEGAESVELLRWSIPVRIESEGEPRMVPIEGVTLWEPLAGSSAPGEAREGAS